MQSMLFPFPKASHCFEHLRFLLPVLLSSGHTGMVCFSDKPSQSSPWALEGLFPLPSMLCPQSLHGWCLPEKSLQVEWSSFPNRLSRHSVLFSSPPKKMLFIYCFSYVMYLLPHCCSLPLHSNPSLLSGSC